MLEPSETILRQAGPTSDIITSARTNAGHTLDDLSHDRPMLIIFLRHSGCPFCIEAMTDLSKQRRVIESSGVGVVLVHMGDEPGSQEFFDSNGVGDIPRISDPEQKLYMSFGLKRGNLWQLGGPKVWWRVFQAGLVGKRVGKAVGDAWQMPGAFLLHRGEIIAAFRHRSQADRPDYVRLACPRNEFASER